MSASLNRAAELVALLEEDIKAIVRNASDKDDQNVSKAAVRILDQVRALQDYLREVK